MKIIIDCNEKEVVYSASGKMTSGMIKLIIGQMEQIKLRLLQDLESTLDEGYGQERKINMI